MFRGDAIRRPRSPLAFRTETAPLDARPLADGQFTGAHVPAVAVPLRLALLLGLTLALPEAFPAGLPEALPPATGAMPWWGWPIALFVVCFLLGIIAVPAGVGGGVLFVPIVGGFFPFHLDFVRGAGLLVALASALSAGPSLLGGGFASLRLALPLALVASASSILGAMIGFALPTHVVQTALGATILGIVVLMASAKKSEYPSVPAPDALSAALGMNGILVEAGTGRRVPWHVHCTPQGLAVFFVIGLLAGLFGLGAGWANLPALNLLMGALLEVSAGTSSFILSLVDSSAACATLHPGWSC